MNILSKSSHALWWKTAVFYQIYPRSFYDSNNDGIGDLPGIISKLDYLNDGKGGGLGVDALWLSPFFPSPMRDFGYDVSDYVGVDPVFGTLVDFKELLKQCGRRGIRVVIDLVLNHVSDLHPWFIESKSDRSNPKADWFIWHDGGPDGGVPNNWLSVFGGSGWTWCESRRQYYYHSFLKEQPDVNWYHPEIREEMRRVLRFWLALGVDGFRLDTANFYAYDPEFKDNPRYDAQGKKPVEKHMAEYNRFETIHSKDRPENFECLKLIRETLEEHGEAYTTIGEIGGIQDSERLAKLSASYVKGNRHLHMAYNFGLLGDDLQPENLSSVIGDLEKHIGDGWPCWSLGNHDCRRLASRTANADFKRSLLALLLFLRGTPILYYGDEVDMPEYDVRKEELQDPFGKSMFPRYKGRDGCRTPFPWQCDRPNQGFNGGAKPWLPAKAPVCLDQVENTEGSTLELLKEILRFRKTSAAVLHGDYRCLENAGGKFFFGRGFGANEIRFMLNAGQNEIREKIPEGFRWLSFDHQKPAPQLDGNSVCLPPNAFAVIGKTISQENVR